MGGNAASLHGDDIISWCVACYVTGHLDQLSLPSLQGR